MVKNVFTNILIFSPPLSWFDYFIPKNGNLNFEFPDLSRHSMIIKYVSLHPTF